MLMLLEEKDLKNTAAHIYNQCYYSADNKDYKLAWCKLTTQIYRQVWRQIWSQVRREVYYKINKL
jgi:hypothetical protein